MEDKLQVVDSNESLRSRLKYRTRHSPPSSKHGNTLGINVFQKVKQARWEQEIQFMNKERATKPVRIFFYVLLPKAEISNTRALLCTVKFCA